MRQSWAVSSVDDEVMRTSAQYGVENLIIYTGPGTKTLPGSKEPLQRKSRPDYEDYLALVSRVKSFGLNIEGVEGGFSLFPEYSDIIFGGPRRDELIQEMLDHVRDMARAGIRVWGYQWMPVSVWRTAPVSIRGGAYGTAYDHSIRGDDPEWYPDISESHDEEAMWHHLEYWIKALTPLAEEEGIRCGIHPDDPPVPVRGKVPGLLRSFDAYKRLLSIYPSDYNAIEFCQGTFSEMEGEDIYEMVDYFVRNNKILFVHFRNVNRQIPTFNEEFINTGYVDMKRIMRVYRDAGYTGTFMDDHCPLLSDDADFPGNVGGYRSRLFAQGYIQGLIESVTKEQQYGGPVDMSEAGDGFAL